MAPQVTRRHGWATTYAVAAALMSIALGWATCAEAACAVRKGTAHVFFMTDREPANDAQLFSGERGLTQERTAVITRGIIGPRVAPSDERRCTSEAAFVKALNMDFNSPRSRAVLIYIHGYYTPFVQAANDALAIAQRLRFPGPMVLYSWPSKVTSRLAYVNDEANAGWSAVHFRELLATLLKTYPRIAVSFAAHSLGARFAGDGIDFIRHGSCTTCVGRALLFAPDIDTDTLRANLSGAALCSGRPPQRPTQSARVTVYVSNKDLALRQSQRLHGHQRAGQAGNEMLLCGGVDTIDVGYFKSADRAGHSYQTDARIAADARAALAGISPADARRKLKRTARPGGTYYEVR